MIPPYYYLGVLAKVKENRLAINIYYNQAHVCSGTGCGKCLPRDLESGCGRSRSSRFSRSTLIYGSLRAAGVRPRLSPALRILGFGKMHKKNPSEPTDAKLIRMDIFIFFSEIIRMTKRTSLPPLLITLNMCFNSRTQKDRQ